MLRKKLQHLEKCLVSAYQSVDLVSSRNSNVSVSEKCEKVLISVSSRTKKQMSLSCLALGPEGLVYNPAFESEIK